MRNFFLSLYFIVFLKSIYLIDVLIKKVTFSFKCSKYQIGRHGFASSVQKYWNNVWANLSLPVILNYWVTVNEFLPMSKDGTESTPDTDLQNSQ